MENNNLLVSNLFSRKTTSLDKIAEFLMNPEDPSFALSPMLLDQYERLEMADDLIKRYGNSDITVKMLLSRINLKRQAKNEEPISKQTVYRIIQDAMVLFGTVHSIKRPYWQQLLVNKEYERYLRCDRTGNDRGAADAIKNIIKLGGFDKPEENKMDPAMLAPSQWFVLLPDNNIALDLDVAHTIQEDDKNEIMRIITIKQSKSVLDQLNLENVAEAESEKI